MKLNGVTNLQSEKFNIAWFKLAESVARKEKERAFSLYRLLAHSIGNAALEAQLEGDLLLAFNDARAYNSYLKAAQLYQREGKLTSAIAVTEHASSLVAENSDCMLQLSYLYDKMGEQKKAEHYADRAIQLLMEKENIDSILTRCQNAALSESHLLLLLEQLTLQLVSRVNYPERVAHQVLDFLMPELVNQEDSNHLAKWLSVLSDRNSSAYEYAQLHLQN